ncbi:hypothetical protein ACQKFO_21625 [Rossellomorea sp. NPDC071047]|uniref:hypothetical protein n=1 Tax=Rossellomorea sp. NPDC071047 TaxID=3390675 RepID=UPI003CFCF52B
MTSEEYTLYALCEEYHNEIRKNLNVRDTAVQVARKVLRFLTFSQIKQILNDIQKIRNRHGNVGAYFCTLLIPILAPINIK